MGGPEMAPPTPQPLVAPRRSRGAPRPPTLVAPRRSRGAPRPPSARRAPAKPWRASTPSARRAPAKPWRASTPRARRAPAKPGRSSKPHTLGAPRRSRGTPRYSDRLLPRVERRVFDEPPAQRPLPRELHDLVDLDLDRTLGPRQPGAIRNLPEDPRASRQLERGARVEGHEEEAHAGIDRDVPERLEHVVPGIVGNAQSPLVEHANEAGLTSTVGGVGAAGGVNARNEERIGALDREPLLPGERGPPPRNDATGMRAGVLGSACLDVLRAIAEDFLGGDLDRSPIRADHSPIDAEPAPALRIDHQKTERAITGKTVGQRIDVGEPGGQAERSRARRRDEAGIAGDE